MTSQGYHNDEMGQYMYSALYSQTLSCYFNCQLLLNTSKSENTYLQSILRFFSLVLYIKSLTENVPPSNNGGSCLINFRDWVLSRVSHTTVLMQSYAQKQNLQNSGPHTLYNKLLEKPPRSTLCRQPQYENRHVVPDLGNCHQFKHILDGTQCYQRFTCSEVVSSQCEFKTFSVYTLNSYRRLQNANLTMGTWKVNYENIPARDRGSSKGFRGISGNLGLLPKYRIRKWRFIKKDREAICYPQSILQMSSNQQSIQRSETQMKNLGKKVT